MIKCQKPGIFVVNNIIHCTLCDCIPKTKNIFYFFFKFPKHFPFYTHLRKFSAPPDNRLDNWLSKVNLPCFLGCGGGGGGNDSSSTVTLVNTPYIAMVSVLYQPFNIKPSVGICDSKQNIPCWS